MSRHRETWIDPHGYFGLVDRILLAIVLLELAGVAVLATVLVERAS